jgi:diguanylate cyclase (GGDEF)-like protein/PAS domain S-box-containing protein
MALRLPRRSRIAPSLALSEDESRLRFELLLVKLTALVAPLTLACWLFMPSGAPGPALASQLIIPVYVGLGVAVARRRPQLLIRGWFVSLLFALQVMLVFLQIAAYDRPQSPLWLAFLPVLLVGAARWEARGVCVSLALFCLDRIVTVAGFPSSTGQQIAQQLILELTVMALLGVTLGFLFRELQRHRERLRVSSASLAASTGVLAAVLENVGEAVLTVDASNHVNSANWAAGELFACEPASLLGCPIDHLLSAHELGLAELAQQAEPSRREAKGRRRDGTTFTAEVVVTMVVGDGGAVRILVLRDVTELRATTAALSYQALHDNLTGLPNRIQLTQALRDRLATARKSGSPFSVLLMDLDHFKTVNDSQGHSAGDALLQAVAQRLKGQLRESDLVARLGGDEFVVVPGLAISSEDAERIAAKLVRAFREPFFLNDVAVDARLSVGVASYPDHGTDLAELMSQADAAMYAAKRASQGWATAAARSAAAVTGSFSLADLRRAVEDGELELNCTPVMDLRDSTLSAVETHVRWRDPAIGILDPEQFMPLAEGSEVIRPLVRCLVRLAIEQQAKWRDAGSEVGISVRVFPRNVHDPHLLSAITELLDAHGLPARNLTLMADEATAVSSGADDFLWAASNSGVRVGIDDFRPTPESLLMLRSTPFTEVRLAADTTNCLTMPTADAEIIRSTIQLAHSLGMTVTAKAVGDEATLDVLRNLNCDALTFLHWNHSVEAGSIGASLDGAAIQAVLTGSHRPPAEAHE